MTIVFVVFVARSFAFETLRTFLGGGRGASLRTASGKAKDHVQKSGTQFDTAAACPTLGAASSAPPKE